MKKAIYLFAAMVMTAGFMSCDASDDVFTEEAGQDIGEDIELRASTLGFPDVASYQTCVAEQCAAGNHENCDILADGTHQACAYYEHSGTHHNGTHHNGTGHGTHGANRHAHGNGYR